MPAAQHDDDDDDDFILFLLLLHLIVIVLSCVNFLDETLSIIINFWLVFLSSYFSCFYAS